MHLFNEISKAIVEGAATAKLPEQNPAPVVSLTPAAAAMSLQQRRAQAQREWEAVAKALQESLAKVDVLQLQQD